MIQFGLVSLIIIILNYNDDVSKEKDLKAPN